MTETSLGVPRLKTLDIMRGLCALGIVIHHSPITLEALLPIPETKLWFGFVWAVDFFFVISGFLVSDAAERMRDPIKFLYRRVTKIWPLYLACMALALLAAVLSGRVVYGSGEQYSLPIVLASIFVFPIEGVPIFGVGWTLEHEVLFYFAMTILLALGRLRHALLVMGLLGASGALYEAVFADRWADRVWDFHMLSPYWVEFFFGVAAYRATRASDAPLLRANPYLLFALAIVFVTATDLIYRRLGLDEHRGLSAQVVLLGLAGASAAIGGYSLERRLSLDGPVFKALILLGESCYAIYLIHWLLDPVLRWVVPRLGFGLETIEAARILGIAVDIAAGVAVYLWIEKPMLRFLGALYARVAERRARKAAVVDDLVKNRAVK